jgi:hypothetical protein
MLFKTLAISTVVLLNTLTANAALTAPVQVGGPSFSDIELGTFTLGGTSNIDGDLGYAPYVLVAPGIQIPLPPVTFNSVTVNNLTQTSTMAGTLFGEHFSFSGLNAGTYSLRTSGSLTGTNFVAAQYVFITTLVPEPETFAMLLAGLGLMGLFNRRRK